MCKPESKKRAPIVKHEDRPHPPHLHHPPNLPTNPVQSNPRRWILNDLKRLCEFRLKDMMTVENVAKMLCATEDFKAIRLQKLCVKYIMDNIKEVTKSDHFREEMKAYPHLCIPILQEAASLLPEPPAKKQKIGEDEIDASENMVE